eukprot:TRINITY_DN2724_c0_g1_i4.p2 TRINITY_DN2724_c0_g1~~TRINITY_DN2724_c0_g1_i4.p2  ORF type:complete len:240 (+),score=43.25 TRINITY_DN2724_c0_g1_i4:53-721(+)
MLLLLVVLLLVGLVKTDNGLDISNDMCDSFTQDTWNCLSKIHNFTIIEGIRGGHGITPNISTCVSQAWSAGFKHVDLYIWMCPNCTDNVPASNLIGQLVNQVGLQNFGMIWLDLEVCDDDPGCWGGAESNLAYIKDMVSAAQAAGAKLGIYSTPYEWDHLGLTGLGVQEFANLPLWYANPDGDESFSDFQSFGGWSTPVMKQYDWNGNQCEQTYDADWYPDV